jgi:cytochrome P450
MLCYENLLGQHLEEYPLKVGDVVIPANMNVAISIETLHHHPDVWPEHDVCIIT